MLGFVFLLLAGIGCAYLAVSAVLITGRRTTPAGPAQDAAVTVLKPLHGDEPNLLANLDALCRQDYAGAVQIVCGVQDRADAAISVVEQLQRHWPERDIRLVVDDTPHGANRKIANLINMMREATHDILVLADSDIAVAPSYLAAVTAALAEPGVGAVTCLYRGRAAAGFWSRLSAQAIDTHFLPNVLAGLRFGLARPCFGSTIVLTRTCLARIGGFQSVADQLADDYAIGAAVREAGFRVAIPEMLVTHDCSERTFRELWQHEVRWSRTILAVDPAGHVGSLVTHPLPWALVAMLLGHVQEGAAVGLLAIGLRIALSRVTEHRFGFDGQSHWLVPARDLLSFAVYVRSFIGRKLAWRGRNYSMDARGRLAAD